MRGGAAFVQELLFVCSLFPESKNSADDVWAKRVSTYMSLQRKCVCVCVCVRVTACLCGWFKKLPQLTTLRTLKILECWRLFASTPLVWINQLIMNLLQSLCVKSLILTIRWFTSQLVIYSSVSQEIEVVCKPQTVGIFLPFCCFLRDYFANPQLLHPGHRPRQLWLV